MIYKNISNLFCCGADTRNRKTQLMRLVGNPPPRNVGDRSESNRRPSEPQSDALTYWATTTESSIGFEPILMDLQSTTYPLGQPDLSCSFLFSVHEPWTTDFCEHYILVVPQGFEPQLDVPNTPVLPLYQRTMCTHVRTRTFIFGFGDRRSTNWTTRMFVG